MERTNRIIAAMLVSPLAAVLCQQPQVTSAERGLVSDVESPSGTVAAINGVRVVAGGAVFVNDRASRRVIMLDDRLRVVKVVLDATAATGALYGQLGTHLIEMPGDSTTFVDAASRSLIVFDAQGHVVRQGAVPPTADLGQLILGNPTFDVRGRIVYRGRGRSSYELYRHTPAGWSAQLDTTPILRLDLVTGHIDTLAFVRIFQPREDVQDLGDAVRVRPVLNPAPIADEWTVMHDGRIAIVRGGEYRVDFVDSSGRLVRGTPIPVAVQRLDHAEKLALLDSSRATRARMLAAGLPLGREVAPLPGAVFYSAPGILVVSSDTGSSVTPGGREELADSTVWASAAELPDRLPLFPPGGIHADEDGDIWVQRLEPPRRDGGMTYDIIGPSGQIADRVTVPRGSAVVGFAASGVILLARRDESGLHLARARYTRGK